MALFIFMCCLSTYIPVFSDGAFAPKLCTAQAAYTRQRVDMQAQAVAPNRRAGTHQRKSRPRSQALGSGFNALCERPSVSAHLWLAPSYRCIASEGRQPGWH